MHSQSVGRSSISWPKMRRQKRETRASLATEYNALEGQLRDALIVENPDDKPVTGGEKREFTEILGRASLAKYLLEGMGSTHIKSNYRLDTPVQTSGDNLR